MPFVPPEHSTTRLVEFLVNRTFVYGIGVWCILNAFGWV